MKASRASVPLPLARYAPPIAYAARTALACAGGRGQEAPEHRYAEIELRVVGRVGDAVGGGDLVEGRGADVGVLRFHLRRLEPLDVTREVGPRQPGRQEQIDFAPGLGEPEPHGEAIGTRGEVPEISPEVLDGTSRVVGRQAGPAHGIEEPGPQGGALGQFPRLVEQFVGGVRIGLNDGIGRLDQPYRERVIHLGQAVLAVGGQEPHGLATHSSSAAARLPSARSMPASS